MADIHLNTTGSNTSPYDTWAKAANSWATAVAGMSAGDRLLVDSAFNTSAAGIDLVLPGTSANPNQILSGTPGATSGLSALSAGAYCATSSTLAIKGSFYAYGIRWRTTYNSSNDAHFASVDGNHQLHESCFFDSAGSSNGTSFSFSSIATSAGSSVQVLNSTFKFGAAGQGIRLAGQVDIIGGGVVAGGTDVTTAFLLTGSAGDSRGVRANVMGFDLSACAAAVNILGPFKNAGQSAVFSDCKLPASWSGTYQTGTLLAGCRSEFYGTGSTGYDFNVTEVRGSATHNAGIYVTGTTTDGVAISDKMTTSANVKFPLSLKGRWYYAYDAGAGSAKTATVQCARDGSTTKFNDDEVWLEVECLGTSGNPLGVISSDRMADVLATPASQATGVGTGSWTGLSGTACSMALAASYTPRNPGYVRARVCLAVPSSTLYVDPAVTLG